MALRAFIICFANVLLLSIFISDFIFGIEVPFLFYMMITSVCVILTLSPSLDPPSNDEEKKDMTTDWHRPPRPRVMKRPVAARDGFGQTAHRKREAAGYRQKGTGRRLRPTLTLRARLMSLPPTAADPSTPDGLPYHDRSQHGETRALPDGFAGDSCR
jgi:hypothetical protein